VKKLIATCLIACATVPALAAAEIIGSWQTDAFSEGVYAATLNDSENLIGQYCYPDQGSCLWLLGLKTRCESGHEYPILANSDVGAREVTVRCGSRLESGLYQYVFTNFDAIDEIVKGSSRLGFAVPLADDQFRVIRFSLDGARAAIDGMRARAADATNKPVRQNTRDQQL
jgi:hypothetical protein